jgi:hypothetical protein
MHCTIFGMEFNHTSMDVTPRYVLLYNMANLAANLQKNKVSIR